MYWKKYRGNVQGVLVAGDKCAAPTRWWNILFLLTLGWPMRAVLVNLSFNPVRVGYRDANGKTMLTEEFVHDRTFCVRIGHEDCTFFAVNARGEEIPLGFDGTFHKTDKQVAGLQLV